MASAAFRDIVDLTNDSDDNNDEIIRKPSKRPKTMASSVSASPMKLHATRADLQMRKEHPRPQHWSWTECQTIREAVLNSKTIQWIVISNFMIQFDFLLNEIPELISIPNVVVFYGEACGGEPHVWKQANDTADFVTLVPSHDPGPTNPLRSKIPYGVHHSKIFLVGYTDGSCRVIVSTLNLLANDAAVKTNGFYAEDFQLKTSASPATSEFEGTLVNYFASYGYSKKSKWLNEEENLTDLLAHYDFSTAKGVLIPSVPGYHKIEDVPHLYGHLKLRQALAQHCDDPKEDLPIVCQFSSIGSLTEKYLREQIQVSMDAYLCKHEKGAPYKKAPLRLELVYPTLNDILNSIEGWSGGGTVPGTMKNVSRSFLTPLYRTWSSANPSLNPHWKGKHVPHIKTFCQYSQGGSSLEWLCLTSHNLSKAAWGEIQNTRYGRRLFVRHWELGVLVTPSLLEVEQMVPAGPATESSRGCRAATIPLPYPIPPEKYKKDTDEPWAADDMSKMPAGLMGMRMQLCLGGGWWWSLFLERNDLFPA